MKTNKEILEYAGRRYRLVPDDTVHMVTTRDDGNTWGGQGVVIPTSGDNNGHYRTSSHRRLNKEAAVEHSRKGGLPPHLQTLCRDGSDTRDDPGGEMVGSGRGQ